MAGSAPKRDPAARRSDDVVRVILDRIRDGDLAPGDKLPNERDLADELDVSRPVVREAISHLAGRGVVQARGGSGSTVTAMNPERAGEALWLYLRSNRGEYAAIHEVREVIETYAAGVAATHSSAEDVERMAALVDRMGEPGIDVAEAARVDLEFHREVARQTHNDIFTLILSSLHRGLIEVREHNLMSPDAFREAVRSHGAILEAIREGSPTAARAAMAAHLKAVLVFWESRGDDADA
ncbi:MAG: FadR/GntR family transcriptional regulator [Actinomycetaceae bacterium]